MNDHQLIKNNLAALGRADGLNRPWAYRWYILALCFVPSLLMLALSGKAEDPSLLILSGQFVLAFGTYFALYQLRGWPLFNPVQAVVFLFHWWFAVGPAMITLFAVLRSDSELLDQYLATGGVSLWIVAFGLPLYAFSASQTIRLCRGRIQGLSFLMPQGPLYRPKTIYAYFILGGMMSIITVVLAQFGIVGNQAINYLGGKVSENWFVSVLEAVSAISMFATVGILGYLAGPKRQQSIKLKLIAIGLITINTITAFTSGSKGALVISFALVFIVVFTWRQKVPIVYILLLALFYLLIVEPFVSQARTAAEVVQIKTPEERVEIFKLALSNGISMNDVHILDVNIESPFRWIFIYADSIATECSLFDGPWDTLKEGFSILVPRVLYPDKPEMNVSNYMARYLGNAAPDNYDQSIGVSIPFEIVGNNGYLAGILSFGLIGVLWTVFCVGLLSEERLATHPLAPLCIIFALGMEDNAGAFLARLRDLPLVIMAAFAVWIVLKKRL